MVETPILQFGTSRFLQAHADLFVSESLKSGHALGAITVVKTSKSKERESRLKGLARPEGYPVHIRGISHGTVIDEVTVVTSIARALAASSEWPEIVRIFIEEVKIVISNTAEGGYDLDPAEASRPDGIPNSFPGKLVTLLQARYLANGRGLTIVPTELVSRNGDVLKAIILELALSWFEQTGLAEWISQNVIFANSLVDRIVSKALEPAGAVAEPYALWAIERKPGMVLPCNHPLIIVADDISSFERLKLFILNLGHTVLVQYWLDNAGGADLTVREILSNPEARAYLDAIYSDEILPGFAARGLGAEAEAYVIATIERFSNPFLDHHLKDIHQHHAEKLRRRAGGFLEWAGRDDKPRLQAMLALA
mgnify:CR=1 FL=1|jgi:tagaturonate reductase